MITWSEAYRRQAISDYEALVILESSDVSYCHKLRYLQMCTEKLAKCFLSYKRNNIRIENTHAKLVEFINATRYYKPLYTFLGYRSTNAYSYFLNKNIIQVAKALEDYYPSGYYDRPNTEYPWEINEAIQIPSEYEFINLNERTPQVAAFWVYISKCFRFFSRQQY